MKILDSLFVMLWLLVPVISNAEGQHGTVSDEVMARWVQDRSYYALIEIVDAYIDPEYSSTVSKARVIELLGQGTNSSDEYPNASDKRWVYSSTRHVPYGSYLIIEFDDADNVSSLEWASE